MSEAQAYLILGASGGIGSDLARRLRRDGARVLLGGRDEERLAPVAKELDAPTEILEASRPEDVERAARSAVERFGRLDGIANCVGSLLLKPAHLTTEAEWRDTIDTNLGSAFSAVRAAARVMRGGGSVVLVSSAAARVGLANHEAIAAAKAGILGLTLSAAASYAGRGLRVNAVAPGLVRTPLTARITSSESAEKTSAAMHALGRIGEPSDVSALMAWLLGAESAWVTGQVFGVDGGLATVRGR